MHRWKTYLGTTCGFSKFFSRPLLVHKLGLWMTKIKHWISFWPFCQSGLNCCSHGLMAFTLVSTLLVCILWTKEKTGQHHWILRQTPVLMTITQHKNNSIHFFFAHQHHLMPFWVAFDVKRWCKHHFDNYKLLTQYNSNKFKGDHFWQLINVNMT